MDAAVIGNVQTDQFFQGICSEPASVENEDCDKVKAV
jgi:hypothetical protein